jgi:hypothetical protein
VYDEESVGSLSELEIELFDYLKVVLPFVGMNHKQWSSADLSSFVLGDVRGKFVSKFQFFLRKLGHYDTSSVIRL